jgi:hypothetical protein
METQMLNDLAPIVLFTYKRVDTLKQTVIALQGNYLASKSDLIIYSDGPKNEIDSISVNEVRHYLKTVTGFKSVRILRSEHNKGLANSIINGVNEVLMVYEKVIVLEDDLISTPNFLDFMNQSLVLFQKKKNVFSISGFSFNLNEENYNFDTYFLNRGWSWGWATWKDRWQNLDWEINDYTSFINDKVQQRKFSQGGSDLNAMLKKQMTSHFDSWAIRWFYNQFKQNGITIYPVKSKILNNGFGIDATHTTGSAERYIPSLDNENKTTFIFDTTTEITKVFQDKFIIKMGYFSRIKSKIQTIFLRR